MSTTKRFSPSWDPETTVVIKIAEKPAPEARTEALIKTGEFVYPAPTTFHKQVLSTLDTSQKYSFFGEHGAIMGERREKRTWDRAAGEFINDVRGPATRLAIANLSPGPGSIKSTFPEAELARINSAFAASKKYSFHNRPFGEEVDPAKTEKLDKHRARLREWSGPGDYESFSAQAEARPPRQIFSGMTTERAWDPPLAHSASVTMRKTLAERGFTRPSMTRPAPEKFRPPTAEEDEHLFKSTIGKRCSNTSRFYGAAGTKMRGTYGGPARHPSGTKVPLENMPRESMRDHPDRWVRKMNVTPNYVDGKPPPLPQAGDPVLPSRDMATSLGKQMLNRARTAPASSFGRKDGSVPTVSRAERVEMRLLEEEAARQEERRKDQEEKEKRAAQRSIMSKR
jgi:hypothetical protein